MSSQSFTARWVFPVSGPPLANACVTVRGDRIEAVEPRGTRAADEDLGNVALIPGLVNPHTHLDLSGARGLIPPTDPDHFTDWLRGVIAYRRARSAEQTQTDISTGLTECLRFGTTLIGDIAAEGASYPAISQAATRAVLFWEVIGLSEARYQSVLDEFGLKAGLSWASDAPPALYPATPYCRWATSPHAPYSANHNSARAQLFMGNAAIHFAESPAEIELLTSKGGSFVDFLKELGVWEPTAFTAGVRDFFAAWPQCAPPVLYVHCNYLPPDSPLAPPHTIVYCPRTHAAFGHPAHPFREFLSRGVRVCLGTDGLASNPDLDVLAEARFVRGRYPDFPGDQLLRMVTLSGAEALGWADECGSLEPGKSADLVAVPLPDTDASDPHELLLADHPGARRTMFRGAWRA
ncbi:MAG: amidohydrolase family protein [Planctomycetes bacterium]|nr:amidohydrolase family protein [Planctomycetota bacterium]